MYVFVDLFVLWIGLFTAMTEGTCSDNLTALSNMPLRQPSRLLGENGNPGISDNNLNYEWYSVVHNGWQFIMIDSTDKPYYTNCSTYYPVYLRDKHPPVNTLNEVPVDVVACKRDYFYPCDIKHQVKIRKCGDEIQYYLPPTKASSAFCFRNYSKLFNTHNIADVNLGDIGIAPELKFTEKTSPLAGETVNFNPYFQFKCSFNVQEGYLYKVNWYVNGDLLVSYGPTTEINELLFHESVLEDNSIDMGFTIYCGVSALTSDGMDAGVTDTVFSKSYYAGIKISSTTIYINKGDTAVVQMTTTVPIGCRYNEPSVINTDEECVEKFQIFNQDAFQCNKAGILNHLIQPNQRCSNGFQTLKKGSIWNPDTVFNFDIVTTDINYDDKRLFYLLLQFPTDTMGHRIWRNYNFPLIKVIVSDNEEYENKICYSKLDPSMRTADGSYFFQNLKNNRPFPGVFMMYNNTKYGIEVQEQTKTCGWATCACGVAIRAGKDVFMINKCGSINYLGFTKCGDGGILQVVRMDDNKYDVFTPIGTKITITIFDKGQMNIVITMAPKDLYNIEGLCGQFDNNTTNDFRHKDGTVSEQNYINYMNNYADFTESWSLTSEETKPLNLFLTGERELKSWNDLNGMFCVCASAIRVAEAACYSTQYLNCTMSKSITNTKCNVPSRRKRGADGHYKDDRELERLLRLMTPTDSLKEKTRFKRQDIGSNIISETAATTLCKDKILGSLAVRNYSEVSGNEDPNELIKQCANDVVAANDTSWAAAHVDSLNNIVKNIIEREPSYVINNSEKVVTFYKQTCPGNCSNNGNCTDTSECDCFGFFHGAECDIDERDPLNIDDVEGGGECDLSDGDECLCFHVRSSSILKGFKCQSNVSKITVNGERELVATRFHTGGYEDIYTGVCCVQDNIIGTKGVFVTKYDFAISNNGKAYGNDKSVYVFDSTCQDAEFTSFENASFRLKTGFCFIDGFCAVQNVMSPVGCLACQPFVDLYDWTVYNPCLNEGYCTDESNGYKCVCVDGYGGKNCELDIDECQSDPCKNDGTCIDHLNAYSCSCVDGFTGYNCETNIDECMPQPCNNGGTCTDHVNGYTCACVDGYFGVNCLANINGCSSNPCMNGGICKDIVNEYECICAPGFEGPNCINNINECTSDPCKNGGTCQDLVNRYECTCVAGYNGLNCDNNINECSSNPCKNGATCTDLVNGYKCTCVQGYYGYECANDINECSSYPCSNGGTCKDLVNGYECTCVAGYYGLNCDNNINECSSNPCKNGATCTDLVNGYKCTCVQGYYGYDCANDINECSSAPCKNGGTCKDLVNRYECTCVAGYDGINCDDNINECSSSPCKNGATCTDLVNGYNCTCVQGYDGYDCAYDINECKPNPCKNGGSCQDRVNGFTCTCMAGYFGIYCSTDINECQTNPCENKGTCEDKVNGRICYCKDGYEGTNCEIDINECSSDPCINGGICKDLVNEYDCTCAPGFEGPNCRNNINECSSNPCKNGGSCTDLVNGYECTCMPGYNSKVCDNEINECSSNPCINGGICKDLVNEYDCTCAPGFEGPNCRNDINECSSNPCRNGGTCTDLVNGYECTCVPGYDGKVCDNDINECQTNPCEKKGTV
ncbi:uncharacterized protein LOC132747457 isoform X4 [Ruditapes philippinarum]|uniref:uncharacterized protein LOC132747457 isoform X4 n=1 Tax=Ruditapes philippinarum TaxID=129788 RepID=UPI00295A86A4|nr:uncharacterized protein LOC132747457 isoform X4 [Ruditapes philippinarum]